MAETLLSPLFTMILENLNSHVLKEFGIASGLNAEIETLKSTLTTIQAVLQDAESKQWKSKEVKDWLRKLKGAASDADNILYEISTEALLRRMDRESGVKHRVSSFFTDRNPLLFHVKMGRKVKNITKRFDAIAEDRSKFHFKEGVIDVEVGAVENRHTSSLVNESEIIGRNEEKEMIIEKLLNNLGDQDHDIPLYAICGMGGLGKTTLAQLVYNDERVKMHFELQIWVCVSDDFDIRRLTRAIIESIEGSPCSISELDPLQLRLQEKLRGKRFLLVLDDVWNEYREKWDGLKNALRCGGKGSMVIVTTRLENVAVIMATLPVHHIGRLSDKDSWSLFKRRAFESGGTEEYSQMETIGKAIMKKCGGVPLALKALGSLMQLKRSESEWLSVKESEMWDLPGDGSTILPALRLSFDNLPPNSRQCFAYCCIFPKDYVMRKDVLIKFWMANSFLPSRGQVDLYDVGCEIFNDLVWRSFFQDIKEDNEGEMTCKMHDLMHDLAQYIMGDECTIIEYGKVLTIPREVCHLYFDNLSKVRWNEDMLRVKSLHSVVCGRAPICDDFENTFFRWISQQRYVRVLHCNRPYISSSQNLRIPKSIGNLIHLKYLDLSYFPIKSLPESTSRLQNLQTLNLRNCYILRKLPKCMKYMRNLRHLDIRGCDSLVSIPDGVGQLTYLQTLSIFIVGQGRGCRVGELKELNLGGELSIKGLDNVRDSRDAKSANLKNKEKLISLSLYWGKQNKVNLPENAEEVLEGLQPHSNLKKLEVNHYQGSQLSSWVLGLVLQNLVELKLIDCGRCEDVPSLGKLPCLRVLVLDMVAVKSLNNSVYGDGEVAFPALEELKLICMRSLEEWKTIAAVRGGESFPCLRDLFIGHCPKLTELPPFPCLRDLVISHCPKLTELPPFPCLRDLRISDCPKLTELPPHLPRLEDLEIWKSNAMLIGQVMSLTSISSLEIGGIDDLMVLPNGVLKNKKALKYLVLRYLSNLKTLSDELDNLTALESLLIDSCPSLESLPEEGLKNLKSLVRLELWGCGRLKSLNANGMRGLSSLRSLGVSNCKKIESLTEGVQHLTALQELRIDSCPEMKCLPDGLQSLSTLKDLYIKGCTDLERRCKKDTGEDWPKISHITIIRINGELIQDLRST